MLIEKDLMRGGFALELHDEDLGDTRPAPSDVMTIERAYTYLFGKEVQLHADHGMGSTDESAHPVSLPRNFQPFIS
jgi:hypothetical protein